MRKVKVFKYEKASETVDGGTRIYYEKVDDGTGLFHQWGLEYEEFDNGIGNYTVAIVEREDGRIDTVNTDLIQFIKDE